MAMKSHGGRWFQKFTIQSGKDSDNIIGASGTSNNGSSFINGFEELANDQRNRLDPLNFFLCSQKLSPQVLGLVTDILLSHCSISVVRGTNNQQSSRTSWSCKNSRWASSLFQAL